MKLFLNIEYQKKMSILVYFNNSNKAVSLEEIALGVSSSKVTVANLISELNNELKGEFPGIKIMKNDERKYYISSDSPSQNIFLEKISLSFAKRSMLFRMVEELFFYGKLNAKIFCMNNYISQATFSRMKQKLRQMLESCNLTLSNSQSGGIQGPEYRIRSFFYQFYWRSYQQYEWPFEVESYQKIKRFIDGIEGELFNVSQIKKEKIIYMLYITLNRISKGQYIKETFHEYEEFEEYDEFSAIMKEFCFEYNITDKVVINNEIHFLFSFFLVNDFLNVKIENLSYIIHLSQFKGASFSISNVWLKEFSAFFRTNLNVEKLLTFHWQINTLHFYLDYFFCSNSLFMNSYMNDNYEDDSFEKSIFEQIKNFYYALLKNEDFQLHKNKYWKNIDDHEMIYQYYLCLYPLILENMSKESVQLFIQNNLDTRIEEAMKQKFKSIFGDRIHINSELNEQVEVIISNCFIDGYEKANKIFVSTFSDQQKMDLAIKIVQEKIILKVKKE